MKELTITAADWGLFEVTEEIVLKEMNVLNEEMFEGLLDIDAIELDIDFLDAGMCHRNPSDLPDLFRKIVTALSAQFL